MSKKTSFLLGVLAVFVLGLYFVSDFIARKKVAGVSTVLGVKGLILPHHDLAASLMEDSVNKIAQEFSVKRVVIFAPNHFFPESYTITSSYEISGFTIDRLLVEEAEKRLNQFSENRKLLENEHGVLVPMTHLRKFFPDASFVPFVFSSVYDEKTIDELVALLFGTHTDETLYVLSLDFAHNKMLDEAFANNQISIESLKNFDYQKILGFNDEYMDSPVAAYAFLKTMHELGASDFEVWHDSHSAILKDDPTIQGTSYVIGVFR